MKIIKAFLLGVWEFRSSYTTHFDDWELMNSYDSGREFAHRFTIRKFET
jgi:hypothetical protein